MGKGARSTPGGHQARAALTATCPGRYSDRSPVFSAELAFASLGRGFHVVPVFSPARPERYCRTFGSTTTSSTSRRRIRLATSAIISEKSSSISPALASSLAYTYRRGPSISANLMPAKTRSNTVGPITEATRAWIAKSWIWVNCMSSRYGPDRQTQALEMNAGRSPQTSQILPKTAKKRVPDFYFGGLRAVLDLRRVLGGVCPFANISIAVAPQR
jgi:hypothetical protein